MRKDSTLGRTRLEEGHDSRKESTLAHSKKVSAIPTDSQIWFMNIFNNPHYNPLTDRLSHPRFSPFSQPIPDTIGPRITFLSQ